MPDPIESSECIPNSQGPCPEGKEYQEAQMPTGVCCDNYEGLPQNKSMKLLGTEGPCLYNFPADEGFVMSGKSGQFITNRPCIELPFLKEYVHDPATGQILQDAEGNYLEDNPPCFDSMLTAGECGCLNRIQGKANQPQKLQWDGQTFCLVNDDSQESNPLIDPADVPIVDQECPLPLTAVLVLTSQEVIEDGQTVTKYGYKVGGTRNPGEPIGIVTPWPGGSTEVPSGYFLCDGTPLDNTVYPDLFDVIGYAHGGAGSSFNLPDYRGRFLRGVDLGSGRDPDADQRTAMNTGGNTGNEVGTVQEDAMQCFNVQYSRFSLSPILITTTAGSSLYVAAYNNNYTNTNATIAAGSCGDPRWSQETRGKNAYVNWIIKAGCPPV